LPYGIRDGIIRKTTVRRTVSMNRKALALVAVIAGMSLIISGCVALAAAGGVAAGAGGYAWARGKLTFTTAHDIMECHDATIAALAELGVKITGDTTDMLGGRIVGKNAVGEPVTIDLEPQARDITKIDIRVGFFGDQAQSLRIADGIRQNL
jgi:hypothetical protein